MPKLLVWGTEERIRTRRGVQLILPPPRERPAAGSSTDRGNAITDVVANVEPARHAMALAFVVARAALAPCRAVNPKLVVDHERGARTRASPRTRRRTERTGDAGLTSLRSAAQL